MLCPVRIPGADRCSVLHVGASKHRLQGVHRIGDLKLRFRGGAPAARPRGARVVCAHARKEPAAAQTPHSGYHYDGSGRKFFEGWYFRVTLPGEATSFAFMYSIEDPVGSSEQCGVGAQIMGPADSYLVQHTPDVRGFWAAPHTLELGHAFASAGPAPRGMLAPDAFDARVGAGFQVSATWHQGELYAEDGSVGPGPESTFKHARWAYQTTPLAGWGGGAGAQQLATAGWLAALPVFEPHWQILMSLGRSTGWIEVDGQRYEFQDAPAYAEKNWGGAFPLKWFWAQCNSFEGQPGLALTAGGGRRELPVLGGQEDVALIGVHWDGEFIGLVPWEAAVEWEIEQWGSWRMSGVGREYEAEVCAECAADAGTTLRAPTATEGLAGFCRDTFAGRLRLQVWRRTPAGARGELVVDAASESAALEVGGGPWWGPWKGTAEMQEPLRSFVTAAPPETEAVLDRLPWPLKPPGL